MLLLRSYGALLLIGLLLLALATALFIKGGVGATELRQLANVTSTLAEEALEEARDPHNPLGLLLNASSRLVGDAFDLGDSNPLGGLLNASQEALGAALGAALEPASPLGQLLNTSSRAVSSALDLGNPLDGLGNLTGFGNLTAPHLPLQPFPLSLPLPSLNLSGPPIATLSDALAAAPEAQAATYLHAATAVSVVLLVYALVLCLQRKQIQRTVALVKEATSALRHSSGLVLLPVFIAAFQLAAIGFCLLLLLSVLSDDSGQGYQEIASSLEQLHQAQPALNVSWGLSPSHTKLALGGFVTFLLLWTYTFLSAVGVLVIAANVFYFFFVGRDTVRKGAYLAQYDDNQTDWPVLTHLCYAIRFHLGTAAFGSLVLTMALAVQIATEGLIRTMREEQASQTHRLVAGCVRCCLWCFEKSIELVNSYAYVYVFIENVGFCTGCAHTFALVSAHPAQLAINTTVQLMLSCVQSIATPLACVLLADIAMEAYPLQPDAARGDATAELVVLGAVFALSFVLTRAFAGVYEQVVTSLTVCVLHDLKEYNGRFVGGSLRGAFDLPLDLTRETRSSSSSLISK